MWKNLFGRTWLKFGCKWAPLRQRVTASLLQQTLMMRWHLTQADYLDTYVQIKTLSQVLPCSRHTLSCCAAMCSLLTSGGIIPLLDGGMRTRKSGLRLPIPMFPPGGGGDLVGMTLPRPLPLGELRMPGEPLGLTKPFPVEVHDDRNTSSNHQVWLTTLTVIKPTSHTAPFSRHCTQR